MNRYIFGLLGSILALSTLVSNQVSAQVSTQIEQTQSQGYDPGLVPRTTVLDSWMEPTVVRTREITNAAGEKQQIAEPIIMERHEQVIVPVSRDITTRTTVTGARAMSAQRTYVATEESRPAQIKHKYFVAHKHYRRATIAHSLSRSRKYVARQTVTEAAPANVSVDRQVVERSVVIERKDPSLNWY